MSYLYLDDGHPDSMEYENNYFHFNGNNVDILSLLSQTMQGRDPSDPELRNRVKEICDASFQKSNKISKMRPLTRTLQQVVTMLSAMVANA